MEMYCLLIGGHDHVQKWMNDVAAQLFPMDIPEYKKDQLVKAGVITEEQKKKLQHVVQVQVRDVRPVVLVYPEYAHNTIKRMIMPSGGYDTNNKFINILKKALSPFLKAIGIKLIHNKELEKIEHLSPLRIINKYVRVVPLGFRKDLVYKGEEML